MNGAGGLVAAGAVVVCGAVFGWRVAVRPRGVFVLVGEEFFQAGDGVEADLIGELLRGEGRERHRGGRGIMNCGIGGCARISVLVC